MAVLGNVEPKEVFRFFEEICGIPHGSGDMQRISGHCVAFAKERGLEVIQDAVGNVIIRKPGTAGYESSEPVIIQGHMDMVCEKRPESGHNFKTDGLQLYVEDGYVRAKDTTLGGDDGIAVAMAMALLDSGDIPHPPLEVLLTVEEETGMGGAEAVDLSGLGGTKLINVDSDEEGVLTAGCAGGFRYETVVPAVREKAEGTEAAIRLHGLLGGHSGVEIHRQRGNAHKMLGRLLHRMSAEIPFRLVEIQGGAKDNVIAMESAARIVVAPADAGKVKAFAEEMKNILELEFEGKEPGLALDVVLAGNTVAEAFDKDGTGRVLAYLVTAPDGVQRMCMSLENLVETSLNVGIVETCADSVKFVHLVRSSVESRKQQMKEVLGQCAALVSGKGTVLSEYPAWQYRPESELRDCMAEAYEKMFGKKPVVSAVHAGLECGLFTGKRPELDCVSIGPDMLDIHSFHERLDIGSTGRVWNYLKEVLARLK